MAEKITLHPLSARIVVRPDKAKEVTPGGIALPESAREKINQGVVLAVGPGELLDSGERARSQLNVGDRIQYGSYAGNEVEHKGEKLLIMSEKDALAIVE